MSKLASVVLLTLAVVVPSWAFNCPVVIKQAEDLVRKAEAGKMSPDTQPPPDQEKKKLAEAQAHHENAKTQSDHADAAAKAKIAAAFAEGGVAPPTPQRV